MPPAAANPAAPATPAAPAAAAPPMPIPLPSTSTSGMDASPMSGMSVSIPGADTSPPAIENSFTSPASGISGIDTSGISAFPAIPAAAAPATPAAPAIPAALAPPDSPDPSIVESPSTVISPAPDAAPAAPATVVVVPDPVPIAAVRFAFTAATSHGWFAPPGSKFAGLEPSGWLPASLKPAASAADGESNHTSAFVLAYPVESGRWYFIEPVLPLMG